ncbi:hypothetical protein E2C01_080201 [Portunus trituberculatus]|uniref:Uncharacterized protein n=1 Tax=Portunus trituberculatus TaxID=210409 RepID=A0A5B7IUS8_PORTR|nr:hypothetical protein [Portunus trituberculatus]
MRAVCDPTRASPTARPAVEAQLACLLVTANLLELLGNRSTLLTRCPVPTHLCLPLTEARLPGAASPVNVKPS